VSRVFGRAGWRGARGTLVGGLAVGDTRIMKPLLVVLVCLLPGAPASAQVPAADELGRYAAEGEKALAERDWPAALSAYEKLSELSPDTAEVHAQLGMLYFQLREFGRAVPALQRAIELKPDLPGVDVLLAVCLSEVGRFQEALPGLRKGFEQKSDTAMRRASGLQLQRAYNGLGQDDEAVEVALELTRLYPDDPEVLYHAGRLISDYAYLLTLRLVDVAPTSVWSHQASGEANESLGNYEAALEDYRKVLALEPDRPGIHYRLGRVHLARAGPLVAAADAEALAAQEFEEELRIDPTNANAAYELGELARKSGDLARARELFALAVEHYPDFEPGHLGLGQVLIAQGHPDLALPHLEKAARLDPEDDVVFFQLWQAYRALGNTEEQQRARVEFQRLRDRKRELERLGLLRSHVVTQQELEEEMTPP
jgi:tetratricopeptide (TPR) repeat protein